MGYYGVGPMYCTLSCYIGWQKRFLPVISLIGWSISLQIFNKATSSISKICISRNFCYQYHLYRRETTYAILWSIECSYLENALAHLTRRAISINGTQYTLTIGQKREKIHSWSEHFLEMLNLLLLRSKPLFVVWRWLIPCHNS